MTGITAQGMVFIHSAPRALLPHLEWSLGRVLGEPISLLWQPQSIEVASFRAEHHWQADAAQAAEIASELAGWREIRFEVTCEAGGQAEGHRWSFTPALGLFQAQIDSFGAVLVNEYRIRAALETSGSSASAIQRNLRLAIGENWDAELEPFRIAGMSAPTKWLKSIGG